MIVAPAKALVARKAAMDPVEAKATGKKNPAVLFGSAGIAAEAAKALLRVANFGQPRVPSMNWSILFFIEISASSHWTAQFGRSYSVFLTNP
jgi:hypothetical protein